MVMPSLRQEGMQKSTAENHLQNHFSRDCRPCLGSNLPAGIPCTTLHEAMQQSACRVAWATGTPTSCYHSKPKTFQADFRATGCRVTETQATFSQCACDLCTRCKDWIIVGERICRESILGSNPMQAVGNILLARSVTTRLGDHLC